jgi:hypothetical protein
MQNPEPSRGRHARLVHDPGERSDGIRRAISQGDPERRGGRDRGERKGGPPQARVKGTTRHGRPRPHGHAGRAG